MGIVLFQWDRLKILESFLHTVKTKHSNLLNTQQVEE